MEEKSEKWKRGGKKKVLQRGRASKSRQIMPISTQFYSTLLNSTQQTGPVEALQTSLLNSVQFYSTHWTCGGVADLAALVRYGRNIRKMEATGAQPAAGAPLEPSPAKPSPWIPSQPADTVEPNRCGAQPLWSPAALV